MIRLLLLLIAVITSMKIVGMHHDESSVKQKLAHQIQLETLNTESCLLEIKEGKVLIVDVPDSFFCYRCPFYNDKLATSDYTPLMWLIVHAADDEFYRRLLTASTWSDGLLRAINLTCSDKSSALMMAINHSSEEIIQFLLDKRRVPHVPHAEVIDLFAVTDAKRTALTCAMARVASHGTNVFHRLLDADARLVHDDNTPHLLSDAVQMNWNADTKLEVLMALLRRGADVDAKSLSGYTPMESALMTCRDHRILRALISFGGLANYWLRDHHVAFFNRSEVQCKGEDAFLLAVRTNNVDVVNAYLAKCFDKKSFVNRHTYYGTAFDYAVVRRDPLIFSGDESLRNKQVIHALLDAGADPLTGVIDGLILASVRDDWKIVDENLNRPPIYNRVLHKYVLALLVFRSELNAELAHVIVDILRNLPGQEMPCERGAST